MPAPKSPVKPETQTLSAPQKALRKLGEAFASGIAAGLKQRGLLERDGHTVFATPRRLGGFERSGRAEEHQALQAVGARGPVGRRGGGTGGTAAAIAASISASRAKKMSIGSARIPRSTSRWPRCSRFPRQCSRLPAVPWWFTASASRRGVFW